MWERESGTYGAIDVVETMDPGGKIKDLEEWVRWSFRGLVCCLALAGFGQVRVIAGRRTFEEQVELYGRGRSRDALAAIGLPLRYAKPKARLVTWLQPHMSRHVSGVAIDLDLGEYRVDALGPIGDICRQLGITWGGVWSVRDYAHFEK